MIGSWYQNQKKKIAQVFIHLYRKTNTMYYRGRYLQKNNKKKQYKYARKSKKQINKWKKKFVERTCEHVTVTAKDIYILRLEFRVFVIVRFNVCYLF